ncbi:MAG: hypothetical protein JW818_04515 [Pirellulales bacterium]|nr:hypothetical protein [Pirellulales bacterium]
MPPLTIDCQTATDICHCCDREYPVSRGSVFRQGIPFALYMAGMHGCHGDTVVVLAVAVPRPGEEPTAVTIRIVPTNTQFQMQILDPETSPWRNHAYLGRMLTRQEALASTLKDTFFEIADAVVVSNTSVNNYLNGLTR